MKRSSFLGALLALIATPLLSFGKKKEEPKEWHVRESFVIDEEWNENQIIRAERDAEYRLMQSVKHQVKVWDTGAIRPDGRQQRVRHMHVVLIPKK